MRDLTSPVLIHLKGWLFLAILVSSIALLLFQLTSWKSVLLLVLVVWSSARFYYYLFYVIEKYIDAEYKFSGVLSALRFMTVKPAGSKEANAQSKQQNIE